MKVWELRTSIRLPRPLAEVFAFFADASNLEALTPPFLRFRILNPRPVEMRPGALIDYRIRLRGLPVTWRTRITEWEPPHRFVDEQLRGPYRLWVHEHTFEEVEGGTLCADHVRYAVPGGALVNRFLVEPDVRRIFAYRHEKLQQLFGKGGEGDGTVTIEPASGDMRDGRAS
jgi:ligand-binding SRPBCC domain-containing protein